MQSTILRDHVTRRVVSRAPTRIDLGGGWTDVPPYCEREGGFVCNVAIARYSTVTLAAGASPQMEAPDDRLVQAAVRRAGVGPVRVHLSNDFPVGAGLGGSSAASATLLAALGEWRNAPWDRPAIAELGRSIEVEDLGVAGGRQDHYAATHGGALALTFTTTTSVRRIPLAQETRDALIQRGVLIYTGESRISGETITAVLGGYKRGDPAVTGALQRMRELARDMAVALERADLDALGALLREHWHFQRSLHPSIPTARIDEIISRANAAGALGAKAMGASGGGCVWILCAEDGAEAVRRAVDPLGTILEYGLDDAGVTVANT
jgi:D-glycero-alpha-D-manno-heptose-7-phosphate kinase